MNYVMSVIEDRVKALAQFLLQGLRNIAWLFFKWHPFRLVVSVGLFLSCLIMGQSYYARTGQYKEIISSTVQTDGEDTPQRFKVLEAFVMSTVDQEISKRIERAKFSNSFEALLKKLDEVLSEKTSDANKIRVPNDHEQHWDNFRWVRLGKDSASHFESSAHESDKGLKLSMPDGWPGAQSLRPQNAIITDTFSVGYLFFPFSLLRRPLDEEGHVFDLIRKESQGGNSSPTLMKAVKSDWVLADDIDISRRIMPILQESFGQKLLDSDDDLRGLRVSPVQVYYITRNGLNHILTEDTEASQKAVYKNLFRATTFFPSRPYYVRAFKKLRSGRLAPCPTIKEEDVSHVLGPLRWLVQTHTD
jgi:hypothetical protein